MQNPNPVNLTTTEKIKALGWVAEARDSDGHLISTLAWVDGDTTNENLQRVADFISDYETDTTVSVFPEVLKSEI